MDGTAFFQQCYQYGAVIFPVMMVLGLCLLVYSIVKVVQIIRSARVVSLPLVEEQTVDFAEAGPIVLAGEGPLITFRFRSLKYELFTPGGSLAWSRPTFFRAKTSGFSSSRMEFRKFTLPEPGRYTLRIIGLGEPQEADARHSMVFMRPHLVRSIVCVLGILLGAILFIVDLVFFLLRILPEGSVS